MDFMLITERIISKATKMQIGIMELNSGRPLSCIGIAAISEIRIVMTSSVGCNWPICLLPMMRTAAIISRYRIMERSRVINI